MLHDRIALSLVLTMQKMRAGIAVYYHDNDPDHPQPYFHWALVVTASAKWQDLLPNSTTTIYEIVHSEAPSGWSWHFTELSLMKSSKFRGVVDLFEFEGGAEGVASVDKAIRIHKPDPDPNVVIPGPKGWTCAAWVLKVVLDLADGGWFDLPSDVMPSTMYRTVLDRAWILKDLFGTIQPFPVLPLVRS